MQNVRVMGGVYSTKNEIVVNYGYNTIRSIISFISSANIVISNSQFVNSYLNDGFLSNVYDYSPQYSSLLGTT